MNAQFAPPVIVVMGVTGCGKTTVGEAIGVRLGLPFEDGDELHPQANIDKMASGHPLTDEDRWPWLKAVGRWLGAHESGGGVVGCSALKRSYREAIRAHAPGVLFVHLTGSIETIIKRVSHRAGHFMPTSLVQSQFDTLEPPGPDESCVPVPFELPVEQIVDRVVDYLESS